MMGKEKKLKDYIEIHNRMTRLFYKKNEFIICNKTFLFFIFKTIEDLIIVGSIKLWIYCEYIIIHIQFWDKIQQILFFLFLSRKAFSLMKQIKYFSNVCDQVHSHILNILPLRSENKMSMDVNHFFLYNFNIKICLNA